MPYQCLSVPPALKDKKGQIHDISYESLTLQPFLEVKFFLFLLNFCARDSIAVTGYKNNIKYGLYALCLLWNNNESMVEPENF